MRLPRVRFTVRRMMIAVAAVAFLLWLVLRWDADTGVSLGIGHASIPIVFVVQESGSDRPVEGATIHLQDPDYEDTPNPPYVLDLKTGPDGQATVLSDWTFHASEGIPSGKLRFYRVRYPPWEMRFSAEGYQGVAASFRDYESKDRRFHEDAPPPPIVIRLRRR
jgi:hypothetical protein